MLSKLFEKIENSRLFNKIENEQFLEILRNYGIPLNGNFWWCRFPKMAVESIWAMQNNTNASLIICEEKLIWQEWVTNNFDTRFFISIETQKNHPHEMPKVFIKEPHIKSDTTIHMYQDGHLCLMHSSEYNSKISVLEIRNQAASWCFSFEVFAYTGKWPAAEYKHLF